MLLSFSYFFSWLLVVALSLLPVSNLVSSFTGELVFFIFLSALLLVVLEFTFRKRVFKGYRPVKDRALIVSLVLILALLIFLTAMYEGGRFPILAFWGLKAVRYNEYGVGGVQGLINALYLSLMSIVFYNYVRGNKVVPYFVFFLFLLYPLLIVSRQVLFFCFFQFFLIWFMFSFRSHCFKFLVSGLFFVTCVLIFGVIGDLRVESEIEGSAHSLLVSLIDATPFGSSLPTSFLWFYTYVVTPSSNLLLNIEHSVQSGGFFDYISPLMPSPIRSLAGYDHGFQGFEEVLLINPNLNMGTSYLSAYLTMGWLGMWLHFLVMFFFSFIFILNRRKNYFFALGYVSMIPILSFSIFANLVFYMPVMFQLFVFLLLGVSCKARGNLYA